MLCWEKEYCSSSERVLPVLNVALPITLFSYLHGNNFACLFYRMQICFKTGCIVRLNFPSNLFTFLHSYHPGGYPFFQVFPGILQCLPLKEDFDENHPVYSCIIELFSDQHTLIRQFLPQLLAVFSQVLPSGTLQEGKFPRESEG